MIKSKMIRINVEFGSLGGKSSVFSTVVTRFMVGASITKGYINLRKT